MNLTRSIVNRSVARAREVFTHFGLALPNWAHWNCAQWQSAGVEYDEVRNCMLGWDVTDFGSRDFFNIGRTLFTLRNGKHDDERYPRNYAEKLILDPESQRAPAHFHRSKREDIICRAGGNILVQLTATDERNQPCHNKPVVTSQDGRLIEVSPGGIVRLQPGMSVMIPPRTIHQFWGEPGTGLLIDGVRYTVSGEVSSVCDDLADNFFFGEMERFPSITEDVPRQGYLCHEYPHTDASCATRLSTDEKGPCLHEK